MSINAVHPRVASFSRPSITRKGYPKDPTFFQKISSLLFGSPSFARAHGILMNRDLSDKGKDRARRDPNIGGPTRKEYHPIFRIERVGSGMDEALPKIWLSESDGLNSDYELSSSDERVYTECYPNGNDVGGWKALELANRLMGEGFNLNYGFPAEIRSNLFKAAEILLLHSIQRGNSIAAEKIGDLYSYDLCKGDYFEYQFERKAMHAATIDDIELLRRAWVYYSIAARNNSCMSVIRLFDIEFEGHSAYESDRRLKLRCDKALRMAFDIDDIDGLYRSIGEYRIYGYADDAEAMLESITPNCLMNRGLALSRAAKCFEFSIGCERDVNTANKLYSLSALYLKKAFEKGCWHLKSELIDSKNSYNRTFQELSLSKYDDLTIHSVQNAACR